MYQTVDGKTAIEVMLSNDTVWLTIDKMADLFQRNKSTISRHIKNILECGELTAESTVAFFATTESAVSSPHSKIFFICREIVDLLR